MSDVITLHLVHLMHPVASCGATGMSGRDSRVSAFDIPYCASAYQQVRPVDSPIRIHPPDAEDDTGRSGESRNPRNPAVRRTRV